MEFCGLGVGCCGRRGPTGDGDGEWNIRLRLVNRDDLWSSHFVPILSDEEGI